MASTHPGPGVSIRDILPPFTAYSDPIPRGVSEFGHLHRGWYIHLTPHWGKDTAYTCCQKPCNVLHPKQTRGWRVCKAVAGQGLQCRCILWNESSHYAALLAHVCLTPMVLISSCPVGPWLICQCQSWWMCLWGRVLVPGSYWVFKIQVGQKLNPSFTDLSGASSAAMVSGSCGKQHNFSPEFISRVQHGPININQVYRCFSRSFSSLCSLLDVSFWLLVSQ